MQAAPSWWHCPAERNQGLSEHGEVWRYRLGSGSYPQNATWQMALRCFAKCPCTAHHRQVLPPLCPLQEGTAVVRSQQGLPCGPIGTETTWQKLVVDGFLASPHSIEFPHPRRRVPSTYEAILSDHAGQSTVLTRGGLPRSPRKLAWQQSSSGSMPLEDAVYGSTSQTHLTSNSYMGKCKHIMPNTYNQWELRKMYNCWFELATVWRKIWRNGHLSCGFGLSRYPFHWSESPAKVRSDFTGEQSEVHFMSISAHWKHTNAIHTDFIASNGGVTTFLPRVYVQWNTKNLTKTDFITLISHRRSNDTTYLSGSWGFM